MEKFKKVNAENFKKVEPDPSALGFLPKKEYKITKVTRGLN